MTTAKELRNLFVGPSPIQEGKPFYGRAVEVTELYHMLRARQIVLLHSPSGAGKSSLVQAGLIPKLREARFDVWPPIRVNFDPAGLELPAATNRYLLSVLVSLEGERPPERQRRPAELATMDLADYIDKRPRRSGMKGRPVVLIFDQFEEILTTDPHAVEEKRNFFDALGRALDGSGHLALFVIREDYLGAFAPYRDRIPTQLSNTFRLDLLGLKGAEEAASQTAKEGGREFPAAAELVTLLAQTRVQRPGGKDEVVAGNHVEPVMLQVVCRRLWEAMPPEDRSIDPEDIRTYVNVDEALAGYYRDLMAEAARNQPNPESAERAIREWVGERLIAGGIRRPVRMGPDQSEGLDNTLVAFLVDRYLVRSELRGGATWFELGHDRLLAPVQADNAEWRAGHLHGMQQQARLWLEGNRADALLLDSEALVSAEQWIAENAEHLTPNEVDFLGRSRGLQARKRQQRRERILLVAILAALGVAVVGLGVAVVFYLDAQEEAQKATAAEKAEEKQKEIAQEEATKAKEAEERATNQQRIAEEEAAKARIAEGTARVEAANATMAEGLAEEEAAKARIAEEAARVEAAKVKAALETVEKRSKAMEEATRAIGAVSLAELRVRRAEICLQKKEEYIACIQNYDLSQCTHDSCSHSVEDALKETLAARLALAEAEARAQRARATMAALASGGSTEDAAPVRTDDLFDLSQGARITSSSKTTNAAEGYGVENLLGAHPDQPGDGQNAFFGDGQPAGYDHWVRWSLPQAVELRSVRLFASHDSPEETDSFEFRRAFSSFELMAGTGASKRSILSFVPPLPYGGPPLEARYGGRDGRNTHLIVCFNIENVLEKDFEAHFTQAVDIYGQYSAPRIIELDGFSEPCPDRGD